MVQGSDAGKGRSREADRGETGDNDDHRHADVGGLGRWPHPGKPTGNREGATAVADVLAVERGARQKAEAEIAVLRQELGALKIEVAELRAETRVRTAIDGVEARLAKLETPLARLKAAS